MRSRYSETEARGGPESPRCPLWLRVRSVVCRPWDWLCVRFGPVSGELRFVRLVGWIAVARREARVGGPRPPRLFGSCSECPKRVTWLDTIDFNATGRGCRKDVLACRRLRSNR